MYNPGDQSINRTNNAVYAHVFTDTASINSFVEHLRFGLNKVLNQRQRNIPCAMTISVVQAQLPFEPMVDIDWAASAMPMSRANVQYYLLRYKARFDPPVYRRVVASSGWRIKRRLLSVHDLKVLRGLMLIKGKGRNALLARGDIL